MNLQKFISAPQHLRTSKKWVGKILELVLMATLLLMKTTFGQTVNFSFNTGNLNPGDTITFTNTSTGFPSGTQFIWNFGERCYFPSNPDSIYNWDLCNDTVGSPISLKHVYSQGRPYLVSLKASNQNGVVFKLEKYVIVQAHCICNSSCENVICNGTFEQEFFCHNSAPYMGCYPNPSTPTNIDASTCWYSFGGSPDLLMNNTCSSSSGSVTNADIPSLYMCQADHTTNGNFPAFAGVITVGGGGPREYIQQQITAPPVGKYDVSFWTSLRGFSGYSSNIGLLLSGTPPLFMAFPDNDILIGSPQISALANTGGYITDKNDWHKIEQTININSTMNYVTIGNFDLNVKSWVGFGTGTVWCPSAPPNLSALPYYVVDDVVLKRHVFNETAEIINHDCNDLHSGSINITVDGSFTPYSFLWSNGAMTEDISNLGTGTYTVTVTDGTGCNTIKVFKIYGKVPTPNVIGDHYACSHNDFYTLASPIASYYSYSWYTTTGLSGTGTSVHANINTAGGGILYYVVTDNRSACTSSLAFEVYPCCEPFSGTTGVNLDLSNLSASTLMQNIANYPGFVVYNPAGTGIELITDIAGNPSYQAAINGVFLVDIDMNIAGSNVVLGPGARIKVINGATLTISEGSWLHTCNQQYMWDRIDVVAGCAIIIRKDVLIEEAETAVVLHENATISSKENVTFNRNYKSIEFIGNYNSQYNKSAIANTKFTSINLTTNTLAPIGVPPYAAVRSHIGISATNLLGSSSFIGLQIGNYTTNNPMAFGDVAPNIFNNLDLGIDAENCDLAVYNCNFYNINDDLKPTDLNGITGTAISSVGIKTLQPASTTTIGGNFIDPLTNPVTLMPNNFVDCKRGVFIAETNATVAYNHFLRNTYTGIAFKNGAYYQVTADSNDFINCNRGIAAREMGNATILISRNYYNVDNNYVPASTLRFDRIAFSINNGVKGRVAGYMQNNNYCKGFKACFVLTNVDGYPIAFNNPIIMDMNGPGSPYGIRILGGDGNRLYNNKIEYNGSNSSTNTLWRGISIETCANTLIFSNTMQKLGTGLRFFNCNAQQFVQCNNFDACYRGVELNSSYIGNQGHNNQPNSLPSGNMWQNQPVAAFDVQGVGSYVSSTWYVMSSTPPDAPTVQNPGFPNPLPAPFAVVTGTPQQLNCNPPAVNDDAHVERLLIVIQQTGYFNQLSDEAKYSAIAQTYVELDANRTLMERGTTSDEILKHFYDSISQTDIGMLLEVNQQIQNNDTATASAINKYVSGHYSQDENAALVNETYIRHLDDDDFMLNDYETTLMENIAYQNPMEGGSAVYGAMVLLDLNLNHDFNGYTLRQMKTTKPIDDTYFTVYPNPASDKIVVLRKQQLEVSNRIIVSNTLGQIIYQSIFDVNQGMQLINTTNWNKGVYNMQISSEIDPVYNFKFLIIR